VSALNCEEDAFKNEIITIGGGNLDQVSALIVAKANERGNPQVCF
jgi:hypothetical protein